MTEQAGCRRGKALSLRNLRRQRWRLAVLLGLNALIAAHVVAQKTGLVEAGHTDTLDILRFFTTGAVTAGFILFIVWMLSVPVVGRVLCGWFCHMGAWQEAGSWVMSKLPFVGRRPIVHSRVLRHVLPAFVLGALLLKAGLRVADESLFGGAAAGWGANVGRPVWENDAAKTVIILFTYIFFINGLFGARALCRYGCPFAPIFRGLALLSVFRVRKVAACAECGECSRGCPMGIDVMKEIQTHGAVRDPDCVRCLGCIDRCSFGTLAYAARTRDHSVSAAEAAGNLRLALQTEYRLLPMVGLGILAGVPGVIWGSAFMLCMGTVGLATFEWLRARRGERLPVLRPLLEPLPSRRPTAAGEAEVATKPQSGA